MGIVVYAHSTRRGGAAGGSIAVHMFRSQEKKKKARPGLGSLVRWLSLKVGGRKAVLLPETGPVRVAVAGPRPIWDPTGLAL